jgi:hypothetical protein
MFNLSQLQRFAAFYSAMSSPKKCRTDFTFLLTNWFGTLFVCLVLALAAFGQIISQNIVVNRNLG